MSKNWFHKLLPAHFFLHSQVYPRVNITCWVRHRRYLRLRCLQGHQVSNNRLGPRQSHAHFLQQCASKGDAVRSCDKKLGPRSLTLLSTVAIENSARIWASVPLQCSPRCLFTALRVQLICTPSRRWARPTCNGGRVSLRATPTNRARDLATTIQLEPGVLVHVSHQLLQGGAQASTLQQRVLCSQEGNQLRPLHRVQTPRCPSVPAVAALANRNQLHTA